MYEIHTVSHVYLVKNGRLRLLDNLGRQLTNTPFRWVIPPINIATGYRRRFAEYHCPGSKGTATLGPIVKVVWL